MKQYTLEQLVEKNYSAYEIHLELSMPIEQVLEELKKLKALKHFISACDVYEDFGGSRQ